jgi:hypothetical protein
MGCIISKYRREAREVFRLSLGLGGGGTLGIRIADRTNRTDRTDRTYGGFALRAKFELKLKRAGGLEENFRRTSLPSGGLRRGRSRFY